MMQRAILLLQQSRYDLAEKELRHLLAQEPETLTARAVGAELGRAGQTSGSGKRGAPGYSISA